MPVRFEVSQVIDRPLEKVFHFIVHEHVHNHPRWDPDIELEQLSEGPIGLGTQIRRRNSRSGTPVEGEHAGGGIRRKSSLCYGHSRQPG